MVVPERAKALARTQHDTPPQNRCGGMAVYVDAE